MINFNLLVYKCIYDKFFILNINIKQCFTIKIIELIIEFSDLIPTSFKKNKKNFILKIL